MMNMSSVKKRKERGGDATAAAVDSINKDKKEECHNVCAEL